MSGFEVIVAKWIVDKLADEAWQLMKEVFQTARKAVREKEKAEERGEKLAAVLEEALEDAEKAMGKKRSLLPTNLALRVREYLLTCVLLDSGKKVSAAATPGVGKAKASELLQPLRDLFNVAADADVAHRWADAYTKFVMVTGIEPADMRSEVRPALELYFLELSRCVQDGLLRAFGQEMTPAALERIKVAQEDTVAAIDRLGTSLTETLETVVRQATDAMVTALKASDDSQETVLGSVIEDPDELREQSRCYAALLLGREGSPIERPLHRRIREVLGGFGVTFPHVGQLYVVSSVERLERGRPAGDESVEGTLPRLESSTPGEPTAPETVPGLWSFLGHRCVAVTGAPGSGKTMELCALGRSLASKLEDGTGWLVPLYIRLSPRSGSLKSEMQKASHGYGNLVASALAGREGMSLLLLLDGFDEAGKEVGRSILESLARLLASCPRTAAVLAGRHQCAPLWRDLGPRLGPVLELQPFDSGQQVALVRQLCAAVDPERCRRNQEEVRQAVESVIHGGRFLLGTAELSTFLRTPLYLTLYVAVALLEDDEPPVTLAELMRRFVHRIVRAAMTAREIEHPDEMARVFLEVVEALSGEGSWLSGGVLKEIDRLDVARLARENMRFRTAARLEHEDPEPLAAGLMVASGLFEGKGTEGEGPWTFSLYPFQEYFATRGLLRVVKSKGGDRAEALLDGLSHAVWSADLPRHLASLVVSDMDLGLASSDRRQLIQGLVRHLSVTVQHGPGQAVSPDLNLFLALRDSIVAIDSDLERWAEDRAEGFLEKYANDPVVRQFEDNDVDPDPFMVLCWEEERLLIREQVASVADWLLEQGVPEKGVGEELFGRLQEARETGDVEARIDALKSVLEGLLQSQENERVEWKVEPYGPTLAAFRPGAEEPSWLLIPHGPFVAGDVEFGDELSVRVETVERPFWVGFDPVTVGEFKDFIDDDGYGDDLGGAWWQAFDREALEVAVGDRCKPRFWDRQQDRDERPVVGVTWFEAAAYCLWRSQEHGEPLRLPMEAEWEKASRGLLGRRWPWGCSWRRDLAVHGLEWDLRNLEPARKNRNLSPFSSRGMAGNVREWTRTRWQEEQFSKEVEMEKVETGEWISMRGGSFLNGRRGVRCAYRDRGNADSWNDGVGFRCFRDLIR